MPAKPFYPSALWCSHYSLDITPLKRLKKHTFSHFSRAAPVNGELPYGTLGLLVVWLLSIFARRWRNSSTNQPRESRRRLSCLVCLRERAPSQLCYLVPDSSCCFNQSRSLCGGPSQQSPSTPSINFSVFSRHTSCKHFLFW